MGQKYPIRTCIIQIVTSLQIFLIKGERYMKATGIVRRVEARVIITQKSLKTL